MQYVVVKLFNRSLITHIMFLFTVFNVYGGGKNSIRLVDLIYKTTNNENLMKVYQSVKILVNSNSACSDSFLIQLLLNLCLKACSL